MQKLREGGRDRLCDTDKGVSELAHLSCGVSAGRVNRNGGTASLSSMGGHKGRALIDT